jgi:hypothetical protein
MIAVDASNERPAEEAALYNPAFMASVLAGAAHDYETKSGTALPWVLAFVILPAVLPSSVRLALPKRITASLPNWVHANTLVRFELETQARATAPLIREAITFGLRHGYFVLRGYHVASAVSPARLDSNLKGETAEILSAARLVARWFAKHEPDQVLAYLGLRP